MNFQEYEQKAITTKCYSDEVAISYVTLGLCGEVGEFIEKVRNQADKELVLKELGDGEKIERQDQTIFTFVVYNWFRDKVSILPLSALVVHSRMFKICAHNKKDSIKYDMLNPNLYGGYFMNRMTKFLVLG